MDMVGGGDEHGVDVLLRFEHLAEIGVNFCPRVFLGVLGQVVSVRIAEGDDVLAGLRARSNVARAHATEADSRDVEFLRRRGLALPQHVTRDNGDRGRGDRSRFQETPSRGRVFVHGVIFLFELGFICDELMPVRPQVKLSLQGDAGLHKDQLVERCAFSRAVFK